MSYSQPVLYFRFCAIGCRRLQFIQGMHNLISAISAQIRTPLQRRPTPLVSHLRLPRYRRAWWRQKISSISACLFHPKGSVGLRQDISAYYSKSCLSNLFLTIFGPLQYTVVFFSSFLAFTISHDPPSCLTRIFLDNAFGKLSVTETTSFFSLTSPVSRGG
jgi:hypothetical protein